MRFYIKHLISITSLCPLLIRAAREQGYSTIGKAISKAVQRARLQSNFSAEEIALHLNPFLHHLEDGIYANRKITEALRDSLQGIVCQESAAGYLRRRERDRIRTRRQLQRDGKLGRMARCTSTSTPRRTEEEGIHSTLLEKKSEMTREKTRVALQAEMNGIVTKMHQIHLSFKDQPKRFISNLDYLKGNLTFNQYGRVMNGLMNHYKVSSDWRKLYTNMFKNRQRCIKKGKDLKLWLNTSDEEDIADDAAIRNVRYRLKKSFNSKEKVDGQAASPYVTRLRSKKGKEVVEEEQMSTCDEWDQDDLAQYEDDPEADEHCLETDKASNATLGSKGGPSRPLHDFVLPYNWYTADDTRISLQDLHLGSTSNTPPYHDDDDNEWKDDTDTGESEGPADSQADHDDVLIDVKPHFSIEEFLGRNINNRQLNTSKGVRHQNRPTTASLTLRHAQ